MLHLPRRFARAFPAAAIGAPFILAALLAASAAWAQSPVPPDGEAPATFLGSLEPHKRIFIADSVITDPDLTAEGRDQQEVLIQFSFRKQVWDHLYVAYTQKSFWAVFDPEHSRPIRENNYNPELLLEYAALWGLDRVQIGLWEHESNGGQNAYDAQGNAVNLSRTWNRVYLFAERRGLAGALSLGAKLWIVTDQDDSEFGSFGEDNPDIVHYLGHGELYAGLGGAEAGLSLMLRRGTLPDTGTARVESWLALSRLGAGPDNRAALYAQVFSGYGESLIDYNRKLTRVALGITVR